jgi:hypothetical protein
MDTARVASAESRDRYVHDGRRSMPRDVLVVGGRQVCVLLCGFVTTWNRDHPPANDPSQAGRISTNASAGPPQVSALAWLEGEVERQVGIVLVSRGMLTNMMRRDQRGRPRIRWVDLRYVDAIVNAIGCPEAFYDGRLRIRRRPDLTPQAASRWQGFEHAAAGRPQELPQAEDPRLQRALLASYQQGYVQGQAVRLSARPPGRGTPHPAPP